MSGRDIHGLVVAYHGADQLDLSLGALAGTIPITVIDNSGSAAVKAVATSRQARYVDSATNVGFAAGVNRGLRELGDGPPQDVLLLNPDAVLEPPALRLLARELHAPHNDQVAAVAPRLRGLDGREQRVSWPFPSPARAWIDALGVGRLPARKRFVIGAVLLLRWEAIRDVGAFDERFFLYAEEADWQRRAAARNWASLLVPDVFATHIGGAASDDAARREVLFHAAQETFIRKWYGERGWLAYRIAACGGAAARSVVLGGDRRAEAARRARLYARGPRSCAALPGR